MSIIKINVLLPDRQNAGKDKELFRAVLEVDDNLDFDYCTLTKAFGILFPKDKIIQFTLLN